MSQKELTLWSIVAAAVGYCGGRVIEAGAKYAINKLCHNKKSDISGNNEYNVVSQQDSEAQQTNDAKPSHNAILEKQGRGCWSQLKSAFGY